jgi:hypothetical protein
MNFAHTLAHFFYPRHSNNHKAKFLHSSSLVVFVLVLIFFQVILQTVPLTGLKILGYAANIPPSQIINLTNEKRSEIGLLPLQYSPILEQAAKAKGKHMLANDYWSHIAPDGTEPWAFFIDVGYKYRYAGENLARDFSNPDTAINAWIASPSHRENLLSNKYTEIGVAVVEGDLAGVDTTIIVQMFGTKLGDATSQVPVVQAKPQTEATPEVAQVSPEISPMPETKMVSLPESERAEASGFRVLISPFKTTKGISLTLITTLLAILVIDAVVVNRRKISRTGGRTFAHLAFLGMLLAIVLIARAGQIL